MFQGAGIITPEAQKQSPLRPPVGVLGCSRGTHQDTCGWVSPHDTNVALPTLKRQLSACTNGVMYISTSHQTYKCTRLMLGLRAGR